MQKTFWLLTTSLALGLSSAPEVHPKARENRGFLAITMSSSCLQRMCCFDPSIPNVPWCFRPVSRRAMNLKVICALSVILIVSLSTFAEGKMLPTKCQCKMAPSERKNCGYPGISLAECSKAGCCFNDSVAGVPWCFAPKPKKVKKVCPNNPHARANCGFPGISAEACERKGCCFKAQPAGVPWCFYPHMVEEAC
ncbi:PREDICTED: trefoil factor 2-like [Haliaeetus leucocephalus]|uniref:trefoil factor 2-like n=1 Tax=Haliaeetus leucocephalus TaxID=52644 RepID=UPI00053CE97F|nr:PREDICTED: trefoil factor 2-like [Haliaeetus leucocephalus]